MINENRPIIEVTPKLKGKLCKISAYLLSLLLQFSPFLVAVIIYFKVDLFYAFFALLISYIVVGIVRAKIRNDSIPLKQQEYSYSDEAIVAWFLVKNHYCD